MISDKKISFTLQNFLCLLIFSRLLFFVCANKIGNYFFFSNR